jgi:hypothetical protein
MERMMKIGIALLLSATVVIGRVSPAAAIDITVTGTWVETIDENDLAGGPGSDLVSTYQSAADQKTINITGSGGHRWRVDVRKIDINWHSDFRLYIRRTTTGFGIGWVAGGASYQEITDTYQTFFWGRGNRWNIRAQEGLTGVSVQVPSDTYTTTVYYTVVQTD